MSIVSEDLMMNEEVHDQIKVWYESIDDPYFENKPWQHLYDEEKQIVAELYWDSLTKDEVAC